MKEFEIIIIEDNPNDSELMIRSLKENKLANNLVLLEDGEEAVEYFFNSKTSEPKKQNNLPKVIFLDLKLPKMNGLEILKLLKTNKKTKKIPVIIVTSSKEDPDISTAYELGANSYVVKPVNFNDFKTTICQLGLYWLVVNEKPC
ncbi:MAG: response regulator [Candidatus Cloacimonetes bacterium]|nr:response regulator [Candidatus Cloacimonadota bacterium]